MRVAVVCSVLVACVFLRAPASAAPAASALAGAPVVSPVGATAADPAIKRDVRGIPLVTNVFADTDIRQALADVSAQTGVIIVPDATVQGVVSADLQNVQLEQALTILLQAGGFAYAKMDGYYLVGAPDPENPNFHLLTKTEVIELKYHTPQSVYGLLSLSYGRYLTLESTTGGTGGVPRTPGSTAPGTPQSYRLVVTAPEKTLPRIKEAIALVDRPQAQIMLEAMVVELSDEAIKTVGVDWASKWFRFDLSSGGANLVYSKIANTELVALSAMVTKGTAKLRANPRVATMEGQMAELQVGKETYFQLNTGSLAYPYSTIENINSGITLRVTPRVVEPEGEIIALIEPEVRDVTGKGPNGLPEITFRRANTNMRVADGQSIIIGGLINESSSRSTNKVPLLGDLPLVGNIFRKTVTRSSKSEVVIIITPHIVSDRPAVNTRSNRLDSEIEREAGF